MKITLLGATGKTGQLLVNDAIAAGHEVTALVRTKDKLSARKGLTIIEGSAVNPSHVAKASNGTDVIVSTLGSTKAGLMVPAVKAVIEASKTTGVNRFVLMSSVLTRADQQGTMMKLISSMMKAMVNDKIESEELLRSSGLDWTIVYAATLNGSDRHTVRVISAVEKLGMKHKISRASVAKFIVDEIAQGKYSKKEVVISI